MSDRVSFKIRPDANSRKFTEHIQASMGEVNKEELNDAIEKAGFETNAAGYRYFLTLGMNAYFETDPRNVKHTNDDYYTPMTIRDVLPNNKQEALDIREELLDKIEEELLAEVQNDPAIELDGWSAWLKK